ncbi:hypothetical protein CPter91_4484 [Collimonas pratensis]|uniref:Uncharacterized protein n=1 Tax=Collimonas pratensis TaxID=279113 RepID=A0A127Q9X4_9BURK|nr:hypothetical protein CPter91_4484 [Collimonas pratensis]
MSAPFGAAKSANAGAAGASAAAAVAPAQQPVKMHAQQSDAARQRLRP